MAKLMLLCLPARAGAVVSGRRVVAAVLCGALVGGLASGCVVTTVAPPPRGVIVSGPPPAPMFEVRSLAPTAAAVWVAGYWHWTGMQYAWIPGHWEAAPPMGAVWESPHYVPANGVYVYQPGGWRRGPLPMPPGARPAPPARADALR